MLSHEIFYFKLHSDKDFMWICYPVMLALEYLMMPKLVKKS